MSASDPSEHAFEAAKIAFRRKLQDDSVYEDLLQTTTIDQLWKAIEQVQRPQHIQKRLQHMARIKGFLDKLMAYSAVIDTFVQVKPDIMGLIWGSARLLILWTSNVAQLGDAVTKAMAGIGEALPQFAEMAATFSDNDRIKAVLALFYEGILEFYVIILRLFNPSRKTYAKLFFESIWPRHRERIDAVISSVQRHTATMRNESTLQHIREEHEFRAKSLAHLDKEENSRQAQRFQNLKAFVSPDLYDATLDNLLNRSCRGSADWLAGDNVFLDWLDMSNTAVRLLWLRGIPGAGKTYLSAGAIQEARLRHRTLFVFVSHIYRTNTTARSILQSLLFQLAMDSKDVQAVLVEENERDVLGNTKYVSGLLKNCLKIAGPTYILLDGLDEMDAFERGILMQQIADLEDCTEVKVFVSSRPEDDIAETLKSKATAIRVDKRNSGGIQSYVDKRTQDWMRNGGFDREARDQIQTLLTPVVAAANGMFLFARIILDNVELFSSLEEIEGELKVLPESLDEAYERILARISASQPSLRRKASMILGWIGCAPVAMSRHEMEQALLVDSDSDSKAAPTVTGSTNFVRICGPIVELVDECPRFVHFTVKEYIFGRQTAAVISEAEANFSLAKATLTYLCSGIFNEGLSAERLRDNVLRGKYRLHWFALGQWIALVKRCVESSKDRSASHELLELLLRLALERRNHNFHGEIEVKDLIFRDIAPEWPELSQYICGVLQFRRDDKQADWEYSNYLTWIDLDPSTLSITSVPIHETLQGLLCDGAGHRDAPNCYCATLKQQYGPRVFKCRFPSCGFNRLGFSTYRELQGHIKGHSRPWKCREPRCPYAIIGFAREGALDEHNSKMHPRMLSAALTDPGQDELTPDDVSLLAFELTRVGDLDGLKKLAPYLADMPRVAGQARVLAARMASLPMLEFLTMFSADWVTADISTALIRSGNAEVFRWFLGKVSRRDGYSKQSTVLAREALATLSPEIYAEWETFLLSSASPQTTAFRFSRSVWFREARTLLPEYMKRDVLFRGIAFAAVRGNALLEARLVQTWHRLADVLGEPFNPRFLGWSLTCLARSTNPALTLATELLALGAPVDFPHGAASAIPAAEAAAAAAAKRERDEYVGDPLRRRSARLHHRGMTALHLATRAASEKGAWLARFLLERGADPSRGWNNRKPAQEPGAALMQKWLGESWEQVVERTRPARLALAIQEFPPGSEDGPIELETDDEDETGEDDDDDEEAERRRPLRKRRREA